MPYWPLQIISVKVHTATLPQPEPRTLRAANNTAVGVAAPDHVSACMRCLPIPLAWAKSLPPWCVFSSLLTVHVHTIKTMGAKSAVQVVDRVGEHALVTIPTCNLSNLLGELNRIGLNDVFFTPSVLPLMRRAPSSLRMTSWSTACGRR